MKRAILPVVAAVAAILGMISVARTRTKHEATVPPSAPPASSFEQVVAGVGLVEANSENIDVSCAVSGMVTQLYVKAGDRSESTRLNSSHLKLSRMPSSA